MADTAHPKILVGINARLAERIATDMLLAADHPARRHHLLCGGSGAGKTHTLEAVVTALCAELSLRTRAPMVLRVDSLGVASYTDALYEALRSREPHRVRPTDRATTTWLTLEQDIACSADGRRILLVLDDVDNLLSSMANPDQRRLRMWVNDTDITVLASAKTMTPALAERGQAWFAAFTHSQLAPLTVEDATALVRAEALRSGRDAAAEWLQGPSGKAVIANLHDVLGGSPHVWTVAATHLVHTDDHQAPARAILTLLAPYYRQRLRRIAAVPARILVALARGAPAMTVTELAADVATTNQHASQALARLRSAGWVTRTPPDAGADRRTSLYTIAEPALRAYLRVRVG